MILWPFALKCCEVGLHNLIYQADDQTPYKMLASLESSKIIMLNFHTFGCHAMFWIIIFNQGMEHSQNGSLALKWASILADLPHMPPMLHSSLTA
jgi:hypothetical protein